MIALPCIMLGVMACSESVVDERLKSMSGNDYLALSQAEKNEFVDASLDRFTTWKIWERPDLCDYVLDFKVLAGLYEASAEKAGDNLLAFTFAVDANDECVERGQLFK